MADQIEGIEILSEFIRHGVERQALGLQFLNDRLLAFSRFPALEELVETREALLQRRLGEIAQGFCDELAVLVEIFNALSENPGADAIDINLSDRATGRQR
jgi:hypothetical protein